MTSYQNYDEEEALVAPKEIYVKDVEQKRNNWNYVLLIVCVCIVGLVGVSTRYYTSNSQLQLATPGIAESGINDKMVILIIIYVIPLTHIRYIIHHFLYEI